VLRLPGYIQEEKLEIAKTYLIPRQRDENGLKRSQIRFTDRAIKKIISEYTQEAGLRNLEREIGTCCRKVARMIAEGSKSKYIVDAGNVHELLGPQKIISEMAQRKDEVGIATGLAWTPVGGVILFVEATAMSGGKGLVLTGQLGDVMKESAQAALSYIRSHAEKYEIPDDFFHKLDLHIHIPEGSTPKDGPSAGVTLATAIVSLLTNKPVRKDFAMTGEITLRGKVLPIGGVKEKLLAAHRAGIKNIILPKENEKDLQDIPQDVLDSVKVNLVETMDQVLQVALERLPVSIAQVSEIPDLRPNENVTH
jgi:ATP-dependent Lon protease